MALTDEQYSQVFRYADGEMNADERKAFEALLLENKELNDEVELYKLVQSLSESVEQKTRNTEFVPTEEKKSEEEKISSILNHSRKKWESEQEAELKLKYGVNTNEEKHNTAQPRQNKVIRMDSRKWLVAAAVAGIVCLGAGWWYLNYVKNNNTAIVNNEIGDSTNVINKTTDRVSTGSTISTDSQALKDKILEGTIAKIKTEKRKALYTTHFKPDPAPVDKDELLEPAFVNYENRQYKQAIRDFEMVDIGPLTRGGEADKQKINAFYIHYYKALSYMASNNNTTKAVEELKKSITNSPDEGWKVKAQWYLALAHLKRDETEKTQALLKEVSRNDKSSELKQKAIALSKALSEE